jgi:beta-lactam-binding protein with PASTA domain
MTVYNGRYELSSQVARGGTAQVYLARDLLLDRPVALKVLFPELSADATFVERFRREAQAAANLSHPNIVPVFDWGQSESTYFIVMEYVDGEALSAIIRSQGPLDQTQSASIAADIAKALSYAHRHGVVHRDVKPGNVLITSDGQVKVTDFGIARAMGADEQVTQTGLVMGTATYFSPEQAQGLEVDGRSDIYSLGVVLYEMLTGRAPFTGDSPVAIAYQHVRETPPPPRSINPAISASLEVIVSQAMAKIPAERYQTADEFRADLDRYVRGQTVLARPPSEIAASQLTTIAHPIVPPGQATTAVERVDDSEVRTARPAQRRPATTTKYWLAAGIALLAVIVVAGVITARDLGYLGGAPYFRVPNVLGKSAAQATSALAAEGLKSQQTPGTATSPNQAHTVIAQNPAFPANVRKGDTVRLTVAGSGPNKLVPDVTNTQAAAASQTLTAAGFTVKEKKIPGVVGDQQGIVKSESPSANTQQPAGSVITISVVTGRKTVSVPLLVNLSAVSAAAELTKEGFAVNSTQQTQYSSSIPQGNVVGTVPKTGTLAVFGSEVTLILSNGAGATAPTFTFKEPAAQAISDITSAGLHYVQINWPDSAPTVSNDLRAACLPTSTGAAPTNPRGCQPASDATNLAPNSTIYLFVYVLPGNTGSTGNSGTGTTTTTTTTPSTTSSSIP